MTHPIYDIAIVGGGIVGLATALALTEQTDSLIVLEAEADLASHQTGNNSGVIHSGLYYKPGSHKARLCTEGREALYQFCAEHDIAHDRCGKIVVATAPHELPRLDMLAERGRANGLQNLRYLSAEELREYEPHVAGLAGLHVTETGIVDYVQVAQTYARLVEQAGGLIQRETRLLDCHTDTEHLTLATTQGDIRARYLINCAGLHADRVARLCGFEPGLRIVPFRGEYYELNADKHHLVKDLIYPVPDPAFPFLGVHFTRMIHGGVEAGPNAVLAFKREGYERTSFDLEDTLETLSYEGFWKLAQRYWGIGLAEFYRSFSKKDFVRSLRKLIPSLSEDDIHAGGAGVRAQALEPNGSLVDDFRFGESARMLHVLNAPSPAATASLSIGREIARRALATA